MAFILPTSSLIGRVNQWSGFYMTGTSVIKVLRRLERKKLSMRHMLFVKRFYVSLPVIIEKVFGLPKTVVSAWKSISGEKNIH